MRVVRVPVSSGNPAFADYCGLATGRGEHGEVGEQLWRRAICDAGAARECAGISGVGAREVYREKWLAILRRHPGLLPVDGMPRIVRSEWAKDSTGAGGCAALFEDQFRCFAAGEMQR